MGKPKLSEEEIGQIIDLRRTGHSLNEIKKITGKANTTVFNYIKGVEILSEFKDILRVKQGGSKKRSLIRWDDSKKRAEGLISNINEREKLLILACLYWGEGNKKELNLINSDPNLIKVFVNCLEEIGVKKDLLKITIRVYEDVDKGGAIVFWSKLLGLKKDRISNVNILKGKKKGKLEYGMCRVRVTKGGEYFNLIISMIDLIRKELNKPL